MESEKKLVSILVPVYNEEEALNILYERLLETMNKINRHEQEIIILKNK